MTDGSGDVLPVSKDSQYFDRYENNVLPELTKDQKDFIKYVNENRESIDDYTFARLVIAAANDGVFESHDKCIKSVFSSKESREALLDLHKHQAVMSDYRQRVKMENLIFALENSLISWEQYFEASKHI